MKETPESSAELKGRFKEHFNNSGYDTPLPPELLEEAKRFPVEWAEACMEWESDKTA